MKNDFQERAHHLRNAVDPVAGGVYFAPESHAAYEALGFDGSPISQDGVARPDLKSFFTSRRACMGRVPGEVDLSAIRPVDFLGRLSYPFRDVAFHATCAMTNGSTSRTVLASAADDEEGTCHDQC